MATRQIRRIRVEGNIAYVPLTKGYEAVIDAADVQTVDCGNWFADDSAGGAYAMRNGEPDADGKRKHIRMHRLLLGDPDGLQVDHIDGNTLNNRRDNLRAATPAQNRQNARLRKDSMSGLKGAHLAPDGKKWRSEIQVNGVRHYLGSFETADAAHAAYASASAKLHGQFGRTA